MYRAILNTTKSEWIIFLFDWFCWSKKGSPLIETHNKKCRWLRDIAIITKVKNAPIDCSIRQCPGAKIFCCFFLICLSSQVKSGGGDVAWKCPSVHQGVFFSIFVYQSSDGQWSLILMRLILAEIDVLIAWNPYIYNVYMPGNAHFGHWSQFQGSNHSEAVRWKIAFWQRFKGEAVVFLFFVIVSLNS